jgi:hypothetical protein
VLDALDDDALDTLAERLAPRIAARLPKTAGSTPKGAADYLGLPSVNALHRLSAERRIPASQDREGGKLYFQRSALDRSCPMHPEVVSEQPGHRPECGMKLLPAKLVAEAGGGHEHEHGHHEHSHEAQEDGGHEYDAEAHDGEGHDHHGDQHGEHDHAPPTGSSGKTTWPRSTG